MWGSNRRTDSSMTKENCHRLCELAVSSKSKAYCPYSHFQVGAALLGADGEFYTGCNIENASYGLTICAERTAMAKAISNGCTRFVALAVAISGPAEPSPCGACRQFMVEFGDFPVLLVAEDGKSYRKTTCQELLPGSFSLVESRVDAAAGGTSAGAGASASADQDRDKVLVEGIKRVRLEGGGGGGGSSDEEEEEGEIEWES